MRIAINGFGRIGKQILKIALENRINVVAINDLHGIDSAAYLMQFDSVYHKYPYKVEKKGDYLVIRGKKILVLSEKNPAYLPWAKLGVDVVVESTGAFTKREDALKHILAGAKKVVITAPAENPDLTIVPGVNDSWLRKEHKIISVASCTTNCLAPLAKVLHKEFNIKRALMTTVHAFTNDQNLHDSSHKKPRRGRAGGLNMVPTTTGAAEAVTEVLPELKGRITGLSVRVPVPCGSLVDLVAELGKDFDKEKINSALKRAAEKEMKGIIEYSEEELVSSDIIGNPNSCIIDALSTQVDGNLVKVLAWYDNEYGYSCRVVDVIKDL